MAGQEDYQDDFFKVNRIILRVAGLWPPATKSKPIQFLYRFYAIFIFLFVNIYFTATECVSLLYTYGNEYDFIKNVSFMLTHLMGAIKVLFWYQNGFRMRQMIDVLQSNEFRYEKNGAFCPADTYNGYKKIGTKNSLMFLALAHLTLSSSYFPPFFQAVKAQVPPAKLPYHSWVPFGHETVGSYVGTLAYQAVPMFNYAYSIVGMDTLFMNLMNAIGAHLTIIQGAFVSVRNRSVVKTQGSSLSQDGLFDSPGLTVVLNREMTKICKHLQTIFKLRDDLESLHKYLTLTQALATLFILCSCLYLVSTTPVGSKQFFAEIIYMLAMGFQLALYCWFGNEVTLKAQEMSNYIWHCDWLTSDKSFKQKMLFTMMRMRRPLTLTVGEFAPLTLATFMAIIKASYSFFAVIKNTSE